MGRLFEFDRGRLWLPLLLMAVGALVIGAVAHPAIAQDATVTEEAVVEETTEPQPMLRGEAAAETVGYNTTLGTTSEALDTIWVMIAGFLVMWMQAGFAFVETGLTRAKSAVNICMKNMLDFSFGSITYWLIGFGIMLCQWG